MAKRRYSDEDKAQALAILDSCDGNFSRAARQAGVPRITLKQWADGRGVSDAVSEVRQEKKADLAILFEDLARSAVEAISGKKLDDADVVELAKVAGIATDKMLLLRGEPTSILEQRNHHVRDRFTALYVEVAAERAALVASTDGPAQPLPQGEASDPETTGVPQPDLP